MTSSNLIIPTHGSRVHAAFHYDDPTHTYTLDGKILPSITGILKKVGYVNTDWYTPEARDRGSHVHLAIKFLNKGTLDWASVLDHYIGYVLAYQKLVKEWQFAVELFEVPMHHPDLLFGGTPDLIGTVFGNVPAIIELKTGPVMKWTALQTIAQEMLMRARESNGGIRRRRWGVTLNADGTYSKPKEFKEYERDEAVFRMLNSAVQILGPKTEPVFQVLNTLTPEELRMINVGPLIQSVVDHREIYAA
jgi:hypothetical protein